MTREELVEFLRENLGVDLSLSVTSEWTGNDYINARVSLTLLGEEIALCETSDLLPKTR
jgi:hypothetical protein